MSATLTAALLVRTARVKSGLTQTELGSHAGVSQSVISAYESGHRQPSLPMLQRLIEAAGMELSLGVRPRRRVRFHGPVGSRVETKRAALMAALKRHGITQPRVFGSVARNEDTDTSDLDLLVNLPDDMGLVALGRLQAEVEKIVSAPVDIVPERDLKPRVRARIEAELVPL